MKKTLLDILKYSLSFGLAALLIWLVARKIEWGDFLAALKTTRWEWMIGYVAAAVGALVFRAQPWYSAHSAGNNSSSLSNPAYATAAAGTPTTSATLAAW